MDEQGLDAALLFPTLGCGVEQALRFDIPATMATLRAFNRWLEEDWGFSYASEGSSPAPMLSLADPVGAASELDYLIEHGARLVHIRPAPVPAGGGTQRVHRATSARYRCGLAWRSVGPRRLPPERQRVHLDLGNLGRAVDTFEPFRNVLGVLETPRVRPSDPRHDRESHRPRRLREAPRPARRQYRERIGLGAPRSSSACVKQANQTPVGVPRSPARALLQRHIWVTPYYEEDLHRGLST